MLHERSTLPETLKGRWIDPCAVPVPTFMLTQNEQGPKVKSWEE